MRTHLLDQSILTYIFHKMQIHWPSPTSSLRDEMPLSAVPAQTLSSRQPRDLPRLPKTSRVLWL